MNKISAHMSVYPLRQTEVSPGIGAALDALDESGVAYEVGTMGTVLWGEDEVVFRAPEGVSHWKNNHGYHPLKRHPLAGEG